MASFNRVILIGNLCRDPELKKTTNGTSVTDLRLAVNERVPGKTADGKPMERTCFVDVTVWQQQAEFCQQYFSKGSPILVEGRLSYDEWKNPQGETRSRLRVVADRIQFVGPRTPGGAQPGSAQPQTRMDDGMRSPEPVNDPAGDPDDIPF